MSEFEENLRELSEFKDADEETISLTLCEIVKILGQYEKELNDESFKLFIDGEYDANNETRFERLSNENKIGVMAKTPVSGLALLFILRMMTDDAIYDIQNYLYGFKRFEYGEDIFDNIKLTEEQKDLFTQVFNTANVGKIIGFIGEQESSYSQWFNFEGKRIGGKGYILNWTDDSRLNISKCDIWTMKRFKEELC